LAVVVVAVAAAVDFEVQRAKECINKRNGEPC